MKEYKEYVGIPVWALAVPFFVFIPILFSAIFQPSLFVAVFNPLYYVSPYGPLIFIITVAFFPLLVGLYIKNTAKALLDSATPQPKRRRKR